MTEDLVATLLPAMDLAVFSRGADGAFASMAPPPPWFPRLASGTFPFLGHILEEASEFWRSGLPGAREYGPCAEVDERGREFHYRVRAITAPGNGRQFLVFELDRGSDRLRDTLQKAREHTLAAEEDRAARRAAAAEFTTTIVEMFDLLGQLHATDEQTDVTRALGEKCRDLLHRARSLDRQT